MFAEHLGLGGMLSSPVSRAGGRVELQKPIFAGLYGFSAAELAAARTDSGWQPDFRVSAGLGINF